MEVQTNMTYMNMERRKVIFGSLLSIMMLFSSIYVYIEYHEYIHAVICRMEGGTPARVSFTSVNCTYEDPSITSYSDRKLSYLDVYNELISSVILPAIVIIFFISMILIITRTREKDKVISVWQT